VAALKRRLAAQRPDLVNEMTDIDIDPGSGLQLGPRCEHRLFKSTSRGGFNTALYQSEPGKEGTALNCRR
jgi:hypothetical protein